MATAESEAAVVALIEPMASPVVLTAGSNLFAHPPREPETGIPSRSVFVSPVGQRRDSVFEYAQVMVEVYADRNDYDGGLALARACLALLHCPSSMPSGWTDCQVPIGPFYARQDPAQRHVFRLDVSLCRSLVSS